VLRKREFNNIHRLTDNLSGSYVIDDHRLSLWLHASVQPVSG
jgi:hypothetical protein